MVAMLRTNLVLIVVTSNAFLGVQTSLTMNWLFPTQYEVMCPKGGCNVDGSNIFRCENKECAAIPTTLNAASDLLSLRLANNEISTLERIDMYPMLDTLDLSGNRIKTIPIGTLESLYNLKTLKLSRNRLETISAMTFAGLHDLQHLYLDGNIINTLRSGTFFNTPNLLSLYMELNEIFTIEQDAFQNLYNLDNLQLDHNDIITLDVRALKDLSKVRRIGLNNNLMEELSHMQFSPCSSLEYIDVSFNRISKLHNDSFCGAGHLHTIDIRSNLITTLESKVMNNAENLKVLHLERNPIVNISGDVFPDSIVHVSMQHMPNLSSIGKVAFVNKPNLKTVTINNNPKLTKISPFAFGSESSKLTELDLSGNALRTLDKHLVDWYDLQAMDLTGNQWDCSCNLAWLRDVLEQYDTHMDVYCNSPVGLRGKSIQELPATAFKCSESSSYKSGLALVLLIFIILFIVTATIIVVCRKRSSGTSLRTSLNPFKAFRKQSDGYDVMYNYGDDGMEVDEVEPEVTMINERKKLTIHSSSAEPPPAAV